MICFSAFLELETLLVTQSLRGNNLKENKPVPQKSLIVCWVLKTVKLLIHFYFSLKDHKGCDSPFDFLKLGRLSSFPCLCSYKQDAWMSRIKYSFLTKLFT